ncbi:MAG: fluoride efflux transporter CrcB [Thermoanaerobaculia bacterium]
MNRLLLVCLGGAVGSGLRYLVSGWTLQILGTAFPWGTFVVNATGSFLLGLIMQLSLDTSVMPPELRIALTTGVLGGFTTYSTFNYESLRLAQEGDWLWAAANIGATVFGCLLAGIGGILLARFAVQAWGAA